MTVNSGAIIHALMKHSSHDVSVPKMVYYSGTANAVYMLMPSTSASTYIQVRVIKERIKQDKDGEEFKTLEETGYKLQVTAWGTQMENIRIFTEFMEKHINYVNFEDMLWKPSMSMKVR